MRGENAITRVRDMVGPTDSTVAEKGTIRGDFGQDKMKNVVHASDSVENGQAELKRFFAEGELHGKASQKNRNQPRANLFGPVFLRLAKRLA